MLRRPPHALLAATTLPPSIAAWPESFPLAPVAAVWPLNSCDPAVFVAVVAAITVIHTAVRRMSAARVNESWAFAQNTLSKPAKTNKRPSGQPNPTVIHGLNNANWSAL